MKKKNLMASDANILIHRQICRPPVTLVAVTNQGEWNLETV